MANKFWRLPGVGFIEVYDLVKDAPGENAPNVADDVFDASSSTQTYSWTGSGGAIAGGTATYLRGVKVTIAGGALVGGAATSKRGVILTIGGGALAGGAGIQKRGTRPTIGGGALAGGTATYVWTPASNSYSWTSVGGGIAGGSAALKAGAVRAATGGGLAGGTALYKRGVLFLPSAGGIAGGTAAYVRGTKIIFTGGGIVGGAASWNWQPFGTDTAPTIIFVDGDEILWVPLYFLKDRNVVITENGHIALHLGGTGRHYLEL